MQAVNIGSIQSQEILDMIFVETQNPQLSFVSRGFYASSRSPTIQAKYLLRRYGKENVIARILRREDLKNQLTEDCLLVLLANRAQIESSYHFLFAALKLHCWEKAVKIFVRKYKIVKKQEQKSDLRTGSNASGAYYTVEPDFNVSRLYSVEFERIHEYECGCPLTLLCDRRALSFLFDATDISVNLTENHGISPHLILGGKISIMLHRDIIHDEDINYNVMDTIVADGNDTVFKKLLDKSEYETEAIVSFLRLAIHARNVAILKHILNKYSSKISIIAPQDFIYNRCLPYDCLSLYREFDLSLRDSVDDDSEHIPVCGDSLLNMNLIIFKLLISYSVDIMPFAKIILAYAYQSGDYELIDHLSSILTISELELDTLLVYACKGYHPKLIKSLLVQGARVSFKKFLPVKILLEDCPESDELNEILSLFQEKLGDNFKADLLLRNIN